MHSWQKNVKQETRIKKQDKRVFSALVPFYFKIISGPAAHPALRAPLRRRGNLFRVILLTPCKSLF
ncbi:hypothetical protein DHB64_13785 [Antarcticibacterium sp. W02-3]|nr:hypothetical protein [Antarcticibacterium sp. W02-3]